MFGPQQKVAVGLSGGKDSIVMLFLILQLQRRSDRSPPVEAILVDEGIAGYREESTEYAKKVCQEWNVPLHIVSFADHFGARLDSLIPQITSLHINACTICGTVRRRLLNEKAKEIGADCLAIGHNMDDIAETFLQNILRNDLDKIGTNPPHGNPVDPEHLFVPRVKPLIALTQEDVVRYCFYQNFPMQSVPCPYSTTFPILRKKVQDFLTDVENQSAEIKFNLLEINEKICQLVQNSRNLPINESGFSVQFNIPENTPKCRKCEQPCGPQRNLCYYCELQEKLGLKMKN
jgi:uncharacterized protein (TIGR00269 family)